MQVEIYSIRKDADGIEWPEPTDRCSRCGEMFALKKIGRVPETGEFYHYNGCPEEKKDA
jgi:hypothetical protein